MLLKIQVFCNVTRRRVVGCFPTFRMTVMSLSLRSGKQKMLHYLTLKARTLDLPKRRGLLLKRHGVTSQKTWFFSVVIGRFRRITKSDHKLRHICPPVCRHGTTRLPLDGFSWNLVSDFHEILYRIFMIFGICFSKICRENLNFIKIWTRIKGNFTWTRTHIYGHIARFFLKWKNASDKNCRENQNTHSR